MAVAPLLCLNYFCVAAILLSFYSPLAESKLIRWPDQEFCARASGIYAAALPVQAATRWFRISPIRLHNGTRQRASISTLRYARRRCRIRGPIPTGANEQADVRTKKKSDVGGRQGKTIRPSGPDVSSFEDWSFHSRRHLLVADFSLLQGFFPIGQRYR